jgi:DNA-binding LytR/AlgR family response regulator
MDELENMLDPEQFFRINRSFIVSIKSILQVHDYFNSRLLLTLQPSIDMQVIVSRDKVNAFKGWIGK